MRIVYLHPNLFPPELHAGTELTLDWLCKRLKDGGHEVVVVCLTWLLEPDQVKVDQDRGYTVVRAQSFGAAVGFMAERYTPDVWLLNQMGRWVEPLLPLIGDAPVVTYVHDVSDEMAGAPPALAARASHITNSPVTAAHLRERFGLASTIVPPLFGVDRYAGIQRRGDRVLFVSLQHRKGADVAISIARARPKARFVFLETWTHNREATLALRQQVTEIPNITHFVNLPGLDEVLPHIKLLLMPSRSQEAWGRTASEVQFCGVPVLASSRGALPKTVGPGGVTLEPDEPIERWLAAFDSIMDDPAVYADLSHKALAHAQSVKGEIARAYQTFERILTDAAAQERP